MMDNEGLKQSGNFEKDTKNSRESLLLKKIRGLEENIAELNIENEKLKHDLMHDYLTKLNYLIPRGVRTRTRGVSFSEGAGT